MTTDEIKQIGTELDRVLAPVYEDLDEIKKDVSELKEDMKSVKRTLNEHTDKIDALTVEVFDLHQQVGAIQDDVTTIKEQNRAEHDEIREFTGMKPFLKAA